MKCFQKDVTSHCFRSALITSTHFEILTSRSTERFVNILIQGFDIFYSTRKLRKCVSCLELRAHNSGKRHGDGFSHVIETMAEFASPDLQIYILWKHRDKGWLQMSPQTLPSSLVKIRIHTLQKAFPQQYLLLYIKLILMRDYI